MTKNEAGAPIHAVVSLKDLIRENRMDAPFHIAQAQLRDRVEILRTIHAAEDVPAMLADLPLEDKRCLSVLLRGARRLDPKGIEAAVVEYPHLALALVERDAEASLAKAASDMERNMRRIARLKSMRPQDGDPA